jgi:hypothetical protein
VNIHFDPTASPGGDGSFNAPLRAFDVGTVFSIVGQPTYAEYLAGRVERPNVALLFRSDVVHTTPISIEFGGTVDSPLRIGTYTRGGRASQRALIRNNNGLSLVAECRGNVDIDGLRFEPEQAGRGYAITTSADSPPVRPKHNVRIRRVSASLFRTPFALTGLRDSLIQSFESIDAFSLFEGHSSGLGISECDNLVIRNGLILRAGWAGDPSKRTKFNHGVYQVSNNGRITYDGLRVVAASNVGLQIRSGTVLLRNVQVSRCPSNITFGHAENPPGTVLDVTFDRTLSAAPLTTAERTEGWMECIHYGFNGTPGIGGTGYFEPDPLRVRFENMTGAEQTAVLERLRPSSDGYR